jgi:hypothetical protein
MDKVDVVNAVTTKPGLPASPFGRPDPLRSQFQPESIW